MTPKEIAKELVDKFLDIQDYENLDLDLFCDECGMSLEAAKYCALITVDELIYETHFEVPNIRQRYWKEVKTEIEKL